MELTEHIPLAPFTTFGIGGPARYFARAKDISQLQEALAFAKERNLKVFFLGGGSNLLVSDEGFDGLIIKIELAGVEQEGDTIIAAAGEGWDALVLRATQAELWGVENLSGIPGTVGGAVVQNIGAYGASLSQTLAWTEVFDTTTNTLKRLSNNDCRFGYRDSVFKKESGRYVVLRAALALERDSAPNISYKDLAARFDGSSASLPQIRAAVLEIRKNKFPDLAVEGTAGSYFKNPLMPRAEALKLQEKYPDMPVFDLPESSNIKIPLAWLLDRVLNLRGYRVGSARLFEKQPLVIVADNNSRASDVKRLASDVREKIRAEFGVIVEPEVCALG
ncbi:MAG TPA: UDP-N-acetylmuramate dehydrogenase [Candidatus Paceibacterota bacterium]|nr:UDP-N-acetylmuramate dehydrogenase [Candidatus Paceibacterota bacterium]